MSLVVLLGGARSGKSRLAAELAASHRAPVTFVATGEALDSEMAVRIAAHREERPPEWETIEEPIELERVLGGVDPARTVIVDCLSLWVSNLLMQAVSAGGIETAARRAADAAAARTGVTIAVSNEVGMGVVPMTALGRDYRDLLGTVNRVWVDASQRAVLVVAGRGLELGRVEP